MINSEKNFIIVVPGRLESSRLSNKLLLEIDGKAIITRVLERCIEAVGKEKIVFCTDEQLLSLKADELKIRSIMTKKECQSGTERIASINSQLVKIANNIKEEEFINEDIFKNTLIVNVQGDQPFIDSNLIIQMIDFCFNCEKIPLLTTPIYKLKAKDINNPNVVKTLINKKKQAIYFSRSPIPHVRGVNTNDWFKYHTYYGHVGIYGYRADVLSNWLDLDSSDLENNEKLEQLRYVDNGYYYETFLTKENHISIDTKEQFIEVKKWYENQK